MDRDDKRLTTKPNFSVELFADWKDARRGNGIADDMSNPVWEWMFRGRIDPYHANHVFETGIDHHGKPRWAGCRMGQSKTPLADGRVIWIAGEHEDFYDPDFYIYNDVIVEHPDGTLKIFGYAEEEFPPTDFHSATLVDNDSSIIIVGNLGYKTSRHIGETPVIKLNLKTYEVSVIKTSGDCPGWIHKHIANLVGNGMDLEIRRGEVLTNEGFIENIDDWSLCLETYKWTRLTDRKWPRFQLRRSDGKRLHLYEYYTINLERGSSRRGSSNKERLKLEIGMDPNVEVYRQLFAPSVNHELPESGSEAPGRWRTTRITVDGVQLRFIDDHDNLTVVAEGEFPSERLKFIVKELADKLERIENCTCTIKSIG